MENRVSIDRVTNMPRRPGDTVTSATPTEPDAEAATPGAEYVVYRLVRHRTMRSGVEYKVRWYGYTGLEDTYETANGLPQLRTPIPDDERLAVHRPVLAYAPERKYCALVSTS